MRLLRVLMFILRLLFGVTFILSGFFKLTDPVGTGLIVEEYLNALGLGFLRFADVPFGMVLSLVEFLIGIAVLMCVRMRVASTAGMVMTVFFTVLTFFMAVFDGIQECGCFGQAVHLTMWETFFKNIVLLICIVPVFLFRNRFRPVAPVPAEWAFLATYGVLAMLCTVYSYVNIPLIEFGNFKVGASLAMKYDMITDSDNFETVFVYGKDGVQEQFGLDNLPDTSWHYVETRTRYMGDENDLLFDMTLSDIDGQIVTEDILGSEAPVFIAVVLRPSVLDAEYWERIVRSMDSVAHYGGIMYMAVPVVDSTAASVAEKYPEIGRSLLSGDYKTLVSMVRSNGGVLLVKDGIVVKKWAGWKFDPENAARALTMDSEELTAKGIIAQRLFYESSILMLVLVIIVFRYVCGIIYGRRFSDRKSSGKRGAEAIETEN